MKYLIPFLLMFFTPVFSQTEDAWVYLHDKPDSTYYYNHPLQMLSRRALERRQRMGIRLDQRDIPVHRDYLTAISSANGITVMGKSKWLNAVHVQGSQADIQLLLSLSFVDSIVFANKNIGTISKPHKPVNKKLSTPTPAFSYGPDTVPYSLHRAYILHEKEYTGRDVLIAVLDAGFNAADTSRVLQHIFQDNRVVDTYNFPDRETNVYKRHYHGTVVWTRIAALDENHLIGTAPAAQYALYITEDVYMEMPVEETYWAMGAERADSLGADVINTSLGYSEFDRPEYNHTWEDLDGQTAFISRAAQIATEKGIHVITSAGNSGYTSWRKITCPADARDVIAVGAIDAQGTRAGFSSTGNTADGRIKPDVMSWGLSVLSFYMGNYVHLSGTSLASPIITGFTADLVQAWPSVRPALMKQIILRSSDRFHQPDSLYGYGIPRFDTAMQLLNELSDKQLQNLVLYPNPTPGMLYLYPVYKPVTYEIYDETGKAVRTGKTSGFLPVETFSPGIYFLLLKDNGKQRIFKWIKQP